MAVGLPAVVTRSGGPEHIVQHGDNGFVADSTPEAFSCAMKTALEKIWDLSSIRRNIVDNYSEIVIVERLKMVYRREKFPNG